MTHNKLIFAPKIALYEPDIPQNTAAIIRTCSCLGAALEIIEPCGFLFTDKRFKRVVMDYMNLKKIKFYNSADDFFKSKINKRVILITTKAKKIYTDFKFKKDDTILFGKESAGVPNKVHSLLKNKLKIPMIDKKRSLNLSTSVAIVLAESLRQIK
jgi:tRNA (cytidine/uridine-2'-O-)-methyltransferase|tara:strand:+ start:511 stop:978 length:468 start_codon:yes stop_codon:yes gene_type:complete